MQIRINSDVRERLKVNNSRLENYRDDEVLWKMNKIGYHILDILLVGATGAGKSSTINLMANSEIARVGSGPDPATMEVGNYRLTSNIRVWDTPGAGDTAENDFKHFEQIKQILNKRIKADWAFGFIDMVVLVVEAGRKDMGTIFAMLEDIILPYLKYPERIVIGLNQADFAMKGQNFNYIENMPGLELDKFLEEKAHSINQRLYPLVKRNIPIVAYSAETGYNTKQFLDLIIDNIPYQKRYLG